MRVPLVAGDEWFWDLVGVDEVEEAAAVEATHDTRAWALAAVPAAVVAQIAFTDGLRVVVPGAVLVLELLLTSVLLAWADGRALRTQGVSAPSPWTALFPPLYLFRRSAITHDPRIPLAWFGVAAAAVLASLLVDARLAPVQLPSRAVENHLYEQLFEGRLPLDARTAVITCPTFTLRWVGQDFRCTGIDRRGSVPLEVSVLDRRGALSWQPLQAAR